MPIRVCVPGIILGLTMLLSACSVIPGGASVSHPPEDEDGAATLSVEDVPVSVLQFKGAPVPQVIGDVSVHVDPVSAVPALYYRYDVEGGVNGHYFLMPAAPRLYTVTRVPFFKVDPDHVTLNVRLNNASSTILNTDSAVCAFDLDGRTLVASPLERQQILPGHTVDVQVTGPLMAALQERAAGTLVIWLYGLAGKDEKQAFRFDLPFTLVKTMQHVRTGETMRTRSKEVADSYHDRIDRADTLASSSAQH